MFGAHPEKLRQKVHIIWRLAPFSLQMDVEKPTQNNKVGPKNQL